MDFGAFLILLAVLLLIGAYIAQPFFTHRSRRVTAEERRYSTLMAEYERVLEVLQELDFDHRMGKIPADEYPRLRAELVKKGTRLLQELDALQERRADQTAEERLEAEVAVRRADAQLSRPAGQTLTDEELEALLAARRAARREKHRGFCPACGHPVLAGDSFCASCGHPLG